MGLPQTLVYDGLLTKQKEIENMNKTIEQLEQEAKQAREVAAMALSQVLPYGAGSDIADKIILASVAMVTYQFSLGMQEVSGDGSGEALPEVSQEERDSDGWIKWDGGECPVDLETVVYIKYRNGFMSKTKAWNMSWKHFNIIDGSDVIAYRISKYE